MILLIKVKSAREKEREVTLPNNVLALGRCASEMKLRRAQVFPCWLRLARTKKNSK